MDKLKFSPRAMMKNAVSLFNRIRSLSDGLSAKIGRLRQYVYSDRYCQKFKCSDCYFLRPIGLVVGPDCFSIGEGSIFGKHASLTAWSSYEGFDYSPHVSIGPKCNFGDYLHLTCIDSISIGAGVLTGKWVTITDNSHGTTEEIVESVAPHARKLHSKGPVVIEDNVWIGDKVTILPGVVIGRNSIIGANSVVTAPVPPNCVAAGIPARVISRISDT